jgi:MoCo/4Fe-4S cofactor protein with predicted Tat translocation signal
MKDNKKTYWKGIEQLSNDPEFVKNAHNEFPEYLPINENKINEGDAQSGSSRRDFLKMMGFGIAAASLAACEAPVRKAIPYLNKPAEIEPGVANYYASTYANGGDYCSIVVKTREGRPIKIEGNTLSSISKGGRSAQVEASVLSLYDKARLQGPFIGGNEATWEELDSQVMSRLSQIAAQGGQIRIISNTVLSPTTKAVINDFIAAYPTAQHISYDPESAYGIVKANQESFGQGVIPSYDFSKAEVIVSFAADFLGTWLSPVEYTKQYSTTRKVGKSKPTMSRHFQFESNFSVTGSNADYRTPIRASQEGLVVAHLYNLLAAKAGVQSVNVANIELPQYLQKAANELWANRGKSLVVAGSNDVAVQVMVNAINSLLDNYGTTIDLNSPVNYRQGNDEQMHQFVSQAEAGNIAAVIFYNCNPVYDYARGATLEAAMERIGLRISTNDRMDETASVAEFVAPDHHYLESWNDAEPKRGFFSLAQPTITPIFRTRQAQESFLTWANASEKEYYTYLQNSWRRNQFRTFGANLNFQTFWDQSLHNGVVEPQAPAAGGNAPSFAGNLSAAAQSIGNTYQADHTELELVLYSKVGLGNGSQANNPWLQELPDPITKACWDNYLTISQRQANELGIKAIEGKSAIVNLNVNGETYKVATLVQPGQAYGTMGLAIGYGRIKAGKVANGVGVNAYPLVQVANGISNFNITSGVNIEVLNENYKVAQTQTQQTYMGRDFVVQESILPKYQQDPFAGRYKPKIVSSKGEMAPAQVSLWGAHPYPNHYWGMVIDMNSCTGCSACVVACNAENNIPVVGRQEVLNRREMTWLRIDRYYSSDAPADDLRGLEIAAENPEVTYQPMLCQHCSNAPCETVCPVAATTHSTEGLNQMAYSRCIGTRYCANNCPYKVRRFNWFKYHDNKQFAEVNTPMNDDLGKMVLNPDVTVRARGVMEKCTFCVQRIQAGKLQAKKEGRRPVDGEIVTACASACPADAIIFGDFNDPQSKLVTYLKEEVEERAYHVLEEIGTRPNIYYLTKIRNKDIEEEAGA